MKKFIITIDTEGDNLWAWKNGDEITTNNARYLERFQMICNKYGFKPVWLTNWEMINDNFYVDFLNKYLDEKQCEVGMHLHAWNNPPVSNNSRYTMYGNPYLIEYSYDVMEEKIAVITDLIEKRTGIKPISHRAGRWAMDERYFSLLKKYGYKVDCSYTPGVDWRKCLGGTKEFLGPDYRKVASHPLLIKDVLEVPVSIRKIHRIRKSADLIRNLYHFVLGENIWIRPNGNNLDDMISFVEYNKMKQSDYIMFMIHSSELMPGGSPIFTTESQIENLYSDIDFLFRAVSKSYEGCLLEEYYEMWSCKEEYACGG